MNAQLKLTWLCEALDESWEKVLSIKLRQEHDIDQWEEKLQAEGKSITAGQKINIEIRRKDIEETRRLYEYQEQFKETVLEIVQSDQFRQENNRLKWQVADLQKENKVMREMLRYRCVGYSHIQQTIMYSRPQDFS
jgi:hypothetical protein